VNRTYKMKEGFEFEELDAVAAVGEIDIHA
jgi:hypothetical protein